MKMYSTIPVILVALLVLGGCAGMGREKEKPVGTEAIGFETCRPSIAQCFLAVQKATTGGLESLPFVSIDANAQIAVDKTPHDTRLKTKSLKIEKYYINSKAVKHLCFVSEACDLYGRIDKRIVKIVYRTQTPTAAQTAKIEKWLLEENAYSVVQVDDTTGNHLIRIQKENGLKLERIASPSTARKLAQQFSMIYVKSLQNSILYPETPHHILFILPYDVFEREERTLPKGFESLSKVRKLGISKEEFKGRVKKKLQYILFIYFFDRVDPSSGVSVHFAATAKQRDNFFETEKYYAEPGTWPVIAKTFSIDDVSDTLYCNIFLTKNPFNSVCVGSHRLL